MPINTNLLVYDCDELTEPGFYCIAGISTNVPTVANGSFIGVLKMFGGARITQILFNIVDDSISMRHFNTTWGAWKTITLT